MRLRESAHNNATSCIEAQMRIGVRKALVSVDHQRTWNTTTVRKVVLARLFELGWSDAVRIHRDSKISITSVLGTTGLCLQTGNMSRFYADLLKLETLYRHKHISGAFYLIPLKSFAKKLGSNIANFERLVDELEIFRATVTVPLIVLGFESEVN